MMTWIDRTKARYKPVNPANTLRGRKAKHHGEAFENLFSASLTRARLAFDRMPDGCRTVGRGKLLRVKTPYDWIVTSDGRSAFLDTKSFDTERLVPSCIKPHQLKALLAQEQAGAVGGYVIWFRPIDVVAFANASTLLEITRDGAGMHASELRSLGTSRAFDPKLIFEVKQPLKNDEE